MSSTLVYPESSSSVESGLHVVEVCLFHIFIALNVLDSVISGP